MDAQATREILRVLEEIPEPRRHNIRHKLIDILTLALLAVIGVFIYVLRHLKRIERAIVADNLVPAQRGPRAAVKRTKIHRPRGRKEKSMKHSQILQEMDALTASGPMTKEKRARLDYYLVASKFSRKELKRAPWRLAALS